VLLGAHYVFLIGADKDSRKIFVILGLARSSMGSEFISFLFEHRVKIFVIVLGLLCGIDFWRMGVEQKTYELSLSPAALTNYHKRVFAMYQSDPGDLALAANGVYYISGRSSGMIVIKKTPLDVGQSVIPQKACRQEILDVVRKDSRSYDYFLVQYINQVK